MEGLIANLPKNEFEVVVVTQPGPRDPTARRIEAAADVVIKLPEGFWPAREAIANAECDILIYPEIGMDATTLRLAALRLARFNVQKTVQDKRYFKGLPSPSAAASRSRSSSWAWTRRVSSRGSRPSDRRWR